MSEDAKSFEDRYRSAKFVDFWMSDERMEAARTFWRQKLISFLPFELTDGVHVLDLGAGTGGLSLAILKKFPNAYVTCHDFSEVMLSHARKELAEYETRTTFVQSDLMNPGWSQSIKGPFDAGVSSFVTHTVPERVKRSTRKSSHWSVPGDCFSPVTAYLRRARTFSRLFAGRNSLNIKIESKLEPGFGEALKILSNGFANDDVVTRPSSKVEMRSRL